MARSLESPETDEVTRESPRPSLEVSGAREGVQGAMKALMGARMPEVPVKPLVGKPLGTIDLTSKPLHGKPLATIDLKSKPLRGKPMRTESMEEDIVIISKSLQEWSVQAPQNSMTFDTPDAVKAAYLRAHSHHAPFFKVLAPQLGHICAVIAKSMAERDRKETDALFTRAALWQKNLIFDPSRIKNASDLKDEYVKYAPNDKKRCDVSRQTVDPHFEKEYRNLQKAYAETLSKLKSMAADRSMSSLKPADIDEESFKDVRVFSSAMMKRLEKFFQEHAKPESLPKTLQAYALSLMPTLHVVWQQKNKIRENAQAKAEVAIIEKTIAAWKPGPKEPPKRLEEFMRQFSEQSPHKELLRTHRTYAESLLRLAWHRFSHEQRTEEKADTQSPKEDIEAQASISRIKVAHLSPSLSSALKRKDPSVDGRLQQKFGAVDWDDVMPSLATAIGQHRLKAGGDRIRRLAESQKMEALLSNRQDKLMPFIFALCSFLEGDVDIQRSMRELELSQNPRDAIRIILASDASRRAAMKVRQIPQVWDKFESALSSIGVTLKDLHLHMEDEDRESEEIDMEMLREVEEEKGEVMDVPEQNDDPEHTDSIPRTRGILQKRIAMQETLYGETSGQKPVDDMADEFEVQVVPLGNAAAIAQLRGSLRKRMVLETLSGEVSTMECADEADDSPTLQAQAGVEAFKETPESVHLAA